MCSLTTTPSGAGQLRGTRTQDGTTKLHVAWIHFVRFVRSFCILMYHFLCTIIRCTILLRYRTNTHQRLSNHLMIYMNKNKGVLWERRLSNTNFLHARQGHAVLKDMLKILQRCRRYQYSRQFLYCFEFDLHKTLCEFACGSWWRCTLSRLLCKPQLDYTLGASAQGAVLSFVYCTIYF